MHVHLDWLNFYIINHAGSEPKLWLTCQKLCPIDVLVLDRPPEDTVHMKILRRLIPGSPQPNTLRTG